MNKENASKLWKIVQVADDYLQGESYLDSSHKATAKFNRGSRNKDHRTRCLTTKQATQLP